MNIHAHILTWNEERILPYTLDYYSKFCSKIFIYDNYSTDSSYEIFKRYDKVKVFQWNSNNSLNDMLNSEIKSNTYRKYSRDADWVIVCDCDEFLYHENLIDKLLYYKSVGINFPKISGHDMVSQSFPEYDGQCLTSKIKIGSQIYEPMSKHIIFDPKLDINFGMGAHSFKCNQQLITTKESELKLLHYKFLGFEYVENRYNQLLKRLSEFNKKNKFGEHYYNVPYNYMVKLLTEGYQVI